MDYIIVAIAVVFGAGLTFFSGFGLGTLMLPVFSIFFDVSIAVGATAVVHLSNNLFKFALVHKYIHYPTLWRFGIIAAIFGAIGGYLLQLIDHLPVIANYSLGSHDCEITFVKLVVGILMIFFAIFDLAPNLIKFNFTQKHLPIGGALSGFFGGVSGHQGAFRATFLAKMGLSKEQFIGTSNAISLGVDIARLIAYYLTAMYVADQGNKFADAFTDGKGLLITGIVFAFLGTIIGKQLVKKTTIEGIQKTVGVLLILTGILMGSGIIN